MIIKETTQVGNPIIRKKAKRVNDSQSKEVKIVIKNLVDSMRHDELVGMAAPQIGEGLKIFVTEIRNTKLRKVSELDVMRVFINPHIVVFSNKTILGWEGCGSVAASNLFGKVSRSVSIIVEAQNRDGDIFQLKAKGLLARVIQHEMDHLQGVVFTDTAQTKTYMSKREYIRMKGKLFLK